MTLKKEKIPYYQLPYRIDNPGYINGQGNNLEKFMVIYILMVPFIIYACVHIFFLDYVQTHIALSISSAITVVSAALLQ